MCYTFIRPWNLSSLCFSTTACYTLSAMNLYNVWKLLRMDFERGYTYHVLDYMRLHVHHVTTHAIKQYAWLLGFMSGRFA